MATSDPFAAHFLLLGVLAWARETEEPALRSLCRNDARPSRAVRSLCSKLKLSDFHFFPRFPHVLDLLLSFSCWFLPLSPEPCATAQVWDLHFSSSWWCGLADPATVIGDGMAYLYTFQGCCCLAYAFLCRRCDLLDFGGTGDGRILLTQILFVEFKKILQMKHKGKHVWFITVNSVCLILDETPSYYIVCSNHACVYYFNCELYVFVLCRNIHFLF